ncbi:MAG: energy transducer TonB [Candidatus Acidiferrales bacterium]
MPPALVHPDEELLLGFEPEAPGPARRLAPKEIRAPRGADWLAQALLEKSPTRPGRLSIKVLAGAALEFLVLSVLMLLPLLYTDTIDVQAFTQTLLVAPPPPPPPPPAPSTVAARPAKAPKRVFTASGKLLAPSAIPNRVAMLQEEQLPPEVPIGVVGGVPGGVPGGQMGGVLGGIITGEKNVPVVAPPPPVAMPVRVGGRVKAPRQIYAPQPFYPPLARQARVQGDVLLDAVIDEQGNVVKLSVVSGHPLLLDAAIKTVSQWRYEPTLLNDKPVALRLIVTVHFRLT